MSRATGCRRSRRTTPTIISDLIGLAAVTPDGAALGTVKAVLNFGAGDIIEIATDRRQRAAMVPFTSAAVPSVDINARRIVVVPPPLVE